MEFEMTVDYRNYLDQKISFALYPETRNVEAHIIETTFQDFLKRITTPKITSTKNTLLIGPHRLNNEKTRASKNVEAITLLVFDLDATYEHSFEQLVELFSGYLGAIHSTWSHSEQEPRYRLLLFLKSPIPTEDFAIVRENFLSEYPELSKMADPACKDPSRAYYIFSHPQERAEMARCAALTGAPVDPNQYLTFNHPPYFESYQTQQLGPKHNEEQRLLEALNLLSSDVGYGTGRFYDSNGKPESDYWLVAIWAIASLGWPSGKEIARVWSKKSKRFSESGFEQAWNSYNHAHPRKVGIGSLFKRAKELSWNQNSNQTQQYTFDAPSNKNHFTLLGIEDLAALPPTVHLVKGVLPSSGLAAIYGPSGSGKTFLALDLMMAIACQSDWFGHKVKNVPVTYVGLEGKSGINNRIKAWRIKNPALSPSNFKVILDNFDLMKEENVVELAQAIFCKKMHKGLVLLDTLNQASPGADENTSQDMGTIIKHLKLLQEMTEGLVLIIHHSGKNTNQGLRGHSSLKAALDANIEVKDGDKRLWLLEKSKDGEDGKSFGFRLEGRQLGIDSDGDPITSCTVERDYSVIFTKPEPSGKVQRAALKIIKQALSGTANGRMRVDAGISEIAQTLTTIATNKRTNRARKLLQDLTTGGHLSSELLNDEGWIWLA